MIYQSCCNHSFFFNHSYCSRYNDYLSARFLNILYTVLLFTIHHTPFHIWGVSNIHSVGWRSATICDLIPILGYDPETLHPTYLVLVLQNGIHSRAVC